LLPRGGTRWSLWVMLLIEVRTTSADGFKALSMFIDGPFQIASVRHTRQIVLQRLSDDRMTTNLPS
jgi:hypothetical protein